MITSEGPRGPAYVRFSSEPVARTEPTETDDEVIVDYATDGGVVGVELVSLSAETIEALVGVARKNDLDLAGLFAKA